MKQVRNLFLFQKFQLKKPCKQHADWLCKFTKLEQDIDNEEKFEEYDKTRSELEKIFDKIAESVKIVNGFFGLEKKNAICRTTKTLINAGKEITMPHEINLT